MNVKHSSELQTLLFYQEDGPFLRLLNIVCVFSLSFLTFSFFFLTTKLASDFFFFFQKIIAFSLDRELSKI